MTYFELQENQNKAGTIALMGLPLDHNASFLKGAALAPSKIREAFNSEATNQFTEGGLDLSRREGWLDVGDLDLREESSAFADIEKASAELLSQDMRIVTLGGDHSITYPLVRAHAQKYPGLRILQIDAHPDLYDELDGNRYSHACHFARIMEAGLASRLVQVGIRTMTAQQQAQVQRFGVEVIEMRDLADGLPQLHFYGPVYLSLDMDGLDPAFAPGISHHEPGGLSTRQVISLIQNLEGNLIGADIVEYNPTRDVNGVTGMVAAKLLKEILGRMLDTFMVDRNQPNPNR